jgi:hypothetical protein
MEERNREDKPKFKKDTHLPITSNLGLMQMKSSHGIREDLNTSEN